MPAKLRDRIEIGLLGCRRQIADLHILKHASAQRAHLGHRILLSERLGLGHPHPRKQEATLSPQVVSRGVVYEAIASRRLLRLKR